MTIDSRLVGIIPERSAEDIFAGRVRLTFAGQVYELPTLVIEEEEKWLTRIDAQLAGILAGVSSSGEDYGAIVGLLTGAAPQLLDLLYAYDQTHVLPATRGAAPPRPLERADPSRAGGVGRRKPFTRHRPVRAAAGQPAEGNRSDQWSLARAYEFAAATWGWSAKEVRSTLSYEQLVAYFDAAHERLDDAFNASVEAVRIGTITASDRRAAQHWAASMSRSRNPQPGATSGLTGASLERAVGLIARSRPNLVALPGVAVRRMQAHPEPGASA